MRYQAGTTLLVTVLLVGLGVEWSRPLLRKGEALPAPAISPLPQPILLGTAFPRPGVHQISDGETLRGVIQLTGLSLASDLTADPCLDAPLIPGQGFDGVLKGSVIVDVMPFWMPAGQRLALGLPLHPDLMMVADWEVLPGIGPVLARQIELNRQKYGDFGSLKGLQRVKGVGPKRIDGWRDYFEFHPLAESH